MSDLFSHAPGQPDPAEGHLEPRSAEVAVSAPPREAFDGFTGSIHLWWPLERYSRFGLESHVEFEQDVLLEDSAAGEQYLWGQLRRWDPPSSLELSWQLGGDPLAPTRVRVDFVPRNVAGTVVRLVQDRWPEGAEGVEMRRKFAHWPAILAEYARFMGGPASLD